MRKIREVLRLKFEGGRSDRQIAQSVGIARSSVGQYVRRFQEAGLVWPVSPALTDRDLEAALFPPPPAVPTARRAVPEWPAVHQELRRKGVTLFLLWPEYKAGCPEGFQYSWFCGHYQAWRGRCDRVMRQVHRAGKKLFVDFAGQTVPLVDAGTGEIRAAEIFVAVLGASSYTYAEAVASQALPDWIGAHVRAFDFFGGVPELLVPDNLTAGVRKACRYEPDLNPTYADLAAHYGVAVVPARVRKPRDKAKVEAGVLLVERWVRRESPKQRFGPPNAKARDGFGRSPSEAGGVALGSRACGTGSSPRWPDSTGRSANSSRTSTTAPSRSGPAAAGRLSKPSAGRRSGPCRPRPRPSPSGSGPRSMSIITSNWRAITTRSLMPWWGERRTCATLPPRWKCSIRVSGWRPTPKWACGAASPRSKHTCLPSTARLAGRRNACSAGRRRPAPTRRRLLPPSCTTGAIPNRASAPASACSGSASATPRPGWKPPASGPWPSTP